MCNLSNEYKVFPLKSFAVYGITVAYFLVLHITINNRLLLVMERSAYTYQYASEPCHELLCY